MILFPTIEVAPDTEQNVEIETDEGNAGYNVSDADDGSNVECLRSVQGQEELHKDEKPLHDL